MTPPPRTQGELKQEALKLGLLSPGQQDNSSPRADLIKHIYKSFKINRNIDRASILLVGTSGVGKSSTLNHLFNLKESQSVAFAKTSACASETRTTTEYILEADSQNYDVTRLRLGLVDTPGFNDTDGSKQDACNFYSIKKFYETHMQMKKPNLVFVLIQATDPRIQGPNSNLAKSLRCLRELKLIDTKQPNVVAIITWCTALGESEHKFSRNIESKKQVVRETIFQFLEVNAPVVAIENDLEDLKINGDYTVLPDGTRQVRNLYKACEEVFKKNGDEYGLIIFNAAFRQGNKEVKIGNEVLAKNSSAETLSKDEQSFLEFFTNAQEGGIADPIIQRAQDFITDGKAPSAEAAVEVQNIAGQIKKLGVERLDDLKFLSIKGLNLKIDTDVTPTGEQFLTELGVKNDCFDLTADSTLIVGQGYNILTDSCVPAKIFDSGSKSNKFGLTVPKIVEVKALSATETYMDQYRSKIELVQNRLSHLNISLDVDFNVFSFASKAGFSLSSSHEMSYLIEERLFEASIGNFRHPDVKLTAAFKEEVQKLPSVFDINNEVCRSKFERFFNRWGHFVVSKAYGGGSLEMKVRSTAVAGQTTDISSIQAALVAFFSPGFFDVNSSIEVGDDNFTNFSATSVLASSTVIWNGGARELHKKDTVKDGHAMDQWRNSLTIKPCMLTTEMHLEPISTLVDIADARKRDCTYDALTNFLGGVFTVVAHKEARERKEVEDEERQRRREAAENERQIRQEKAAEETAERERQRRKEAEKRDTADRLG